MSREQYIEGPLRAKSRYGQPTGDKLRVPAPHDPHGDGAACPYLYYRCSWDYRRIGEYLDTSAENIRFTLRSARMFADSLLPERTVY